MQPQDLLKSVIIKNCIFYCPTDIEQLGMNNLKTVSTQLRKNMQIPSDFV